MFAWQATVQDEAGNIVPLPVVTVWESDGSTLASIYNEAGVALPNPLTGTMDGFVQFWAAAGEYKIEGAKEGDNTEVWSVTIDAPAIRAESAADRAEGEADRAESAADAAGTSAFINRGWVADQAALSSIPSPQLDDRAMTMDTEHVWQYNGSAWVDIGESPLALKANLDELIDTGFKAAKFVHNWNEITVSGVYKSNPTGQAAIGAPAALAHLLLEHIEGTSGRAWQRAHSTARSRTWERDRNSLGEWTEWVETTAALKADQAALVAVGFGTAAFVHDWNSVTVSGQYRSNSTGQAPIGAPAALAHLLLEHIEGYQGRAWQRAHSTARSQTWERDRNSLGEWTEWVEVLTTKDIPLSGTGGKEFYQDGELTKISLPESGLWNSLSDSIYADSAALNALYRQLTVEFPDYVTETALGEDDFGNQIYEYRFAPSGFRWAAPATVTENAHPKIVIVTGVHGSESTAMTSALLFFQELCRNWRHDERISDLRWGCELVIVPCLNPSGYDNGRQRRNGNNVDLNQNGKYAWNELVSEYKGAAPMDQPETVIADQLAVRHPTAKVFIDFHAHENAGYNTWVGTLAEDGFAIQKHMLRKHQAWLRRNYEFTDPTDNAAIVASTGTVKTGIATNWTWAHGKRGFLLETHLLWGSYSSRQRRRIAVDALLTLVHENWRVESETTGWISGPPQPLEG